MTMRSSAMRSVRYSNANRIFRSAEKQRTEKRQFEKAWELHPDLIVLDLAMPVMNGLEAAGVLKCLMPTVTLIMYSAFADSAARQEILRKGISELVSKSESFDVLVRKARGVLYPRAA